MPESALCLLALCWGFSDQEWLAHALFFLSFFFFSSPDCQEPSCALSSETMSFKYANVFMQSPCLNGRNMSVCLSGGSSDSSHRVRAVGRLQTRVTLSALMEARDSWSSALTVVKQGLFQTSHLFCLKAHLFYPKAMLWKTSLMMIVIPSGLRCWDDPSSPVRCLSMTYSLTLRASAAYWSQKTHLT